MDVDLVSHRQVRPEPAAWLGGLTVRADATVCLVLASTAEGLAARVAELCARGKRVVCALSSLEVSTLERELVEAGAVDVRETDSGEGREGVLARLEFECRLANTLESPLVADNLVGRSRAWRAALIRAAELANSDADVLITGEPGTGKELIARLIHALDSRRRDAPLVVLDCTTVVAELSGSEFFGHERGAFTGAFQTREGAFAQAHRGTLFLDEVGELALPLQAQLLRAVQERSFKAVGSNEWRRADFRLICATNRPLETLVAHESFRADFFHRIASSRVHLPSLTSRRDDIEPLAHHFLAKLSGGRCQLSAALVRELLGRRFAGNVRELRQLVTRAWHRHVGPGPLALADLPLDDRPGRTAWHEGELEVAITRALTDEVSLKDIGRVATNTAIRLALAREGTTPKAAASLKVSERALQLRRAHARQ